MWSSTSRRSLAAVMATLRFAFTASWPTYSSKPRGRRLASKIRSSSLFAPLSMAIESPRPRSRRSRAQVAQALFQHAFERLRAALDDLAHQFLGIRFFVAQIDQRRHRVEHQLRGAVRPAGLRFHRREG